MYMYIYNVQCAVYYGSLGPSLQDAGKAEDSAVVTKTMFSGNLASSRKCVECGQLNSKMAKKCLQCRSPLQVHFTKKFFIFTFNLKLIMIMIPR